MEQLIITCHIGADADVKKKSDHFLIHFPVACTRRWFDKETSEQKEVTNWYSVFRRMKNEPGKILNHLRKGNKILITGQPSYQVNTHGQGVKVEVLLSVTDWEILSFEKSINQDQN